MQAAHEPVGASGNACLEIRHLRLVSAIALEGSVTKAASCLHFSQSAASHQLVELEKNLGVRLFDRIGKRMVLTAAGTRLLESAGRVLAELAVVERDLVAYRSAGRSSLRVTTSCYTSYRWLPAALAQFAETHPRVDVTIVLEATRRTTEALLADEVDFAITTDPPRDEAFSCEPVVTSEVVVMGRPDHVVMTRGASGRGSGHGRVAWRDFRHATILMPDQGAANFARIEAAVRDGWERESGERLSQPVRFQTIPLTEALVELASCGTGVALADAWIAAPHVVASRGGLIARPLHPPVTRTFHAVYRRANPRGLPLAELARIVRRESERAIGPAKKTAKKKRASATR